MTGDITVLVVEDDSLIRVSIASDLEDAGYFVHEASNAAEALHKLKRFPAISIMFTDIAMPGDMDGLKLALAVRDRWPPIHIMVTTALKGITAADLPAQARFFPKPYNPDAVMRSIHELSA